MYASVESALNVYTSADYATMMLHTTRPRGAGGRRRPAAVAKPMIAPLRDVQRRHGAPTLGNELTGEITPCDRVNPCYTRTGKNCNNGESTRELGASRTDRVQREALRAPGRPGISASLDGAARHGPRGTVAPSTIRVRGNCARFCHRKSEPITCHGCEEGYDRSGEK